MFYAILRCVEKKTSSGWSQSSTVATPYYIKNILVEIVPHYIYTEHSETCRQLDLLTLDDRRNTTEPIEVFNICVRDVVSIILRNV